MRFLLILVVIGGVLCFLGYQEMTLSSGATEEAESVVLANIEKGTIPENPHIEVDDHQALYGGSVYEYEQRAGQTGEPGAKAKVNFTYYGIMSKEHPFMVRIDELVKKHGDLESIPDEEFPDPGHVSILVKTKRFKTIGSIPDVGWTDAAPVQGMVINRIKSLDKEETRLIKETFPNTDISKVLLLEEGRKPGGSTGMAMLGGGVVLILVGLGVGVKAMKG